MHVLGEGMTYYHIHIFMSLYIHIYANIKRFATTFWLDQYFTLIIQFLRSKLKIFTLEHGDVSTSEPHARFLHSVSHYINNYTV
jgi:hypothetical protein